jgi:hypothetical protein
MSSSRSLAETRRSSSSLEEKNERPFALISSTLSSAACRAFMSVLLPFFGFAGGSSLSWSCLSASDRSTLCRAQRLAKA